MHVSTDYVFDGDATTPYAEDATPDRGPRTVARKLAGEEAVREILPDSHYIVRTAWLYGRHGSNFVKTMLRLESERDTVAVVDDQRGQPTYSRDLAAQIVQLFERHPAPGTYHGTNCRRGDLVRLHAGDLPARGRRSGAGAAHDVGGVRAAGAASGVLRARPRPVEAVGIPEMRPWQEALEAAFTDGISAG